MHLLIILFFTFLPQANHSATQSDDCGMSLSYVITQQNDGKVLIVLQVDGGKAPYNYLFFNSKNVPVSWEFTSNSLLAEQGEYPKYAKVRDANGCIEIIEFKESK